MEGGDSCTTIRMDRKPLKYTLQNSQRGDFYNTIKKNKIEKKVRFNFFHIYVHLSLYCPLLKKRKKKNN